MNARISCASLGGFLDSFSRMFGKRKTTEMAIEDVSFVCLFFLMAIPGQ